LERLVVERPETLPDGVVQFAQGKELPVAQRRGDPGGDDAYGPLDMTFVLGGTHPAGYDRETVVRRHLLIASVQYDFRAGILHNTGFQIVALDDPGDSAEVLKRIHMGVDPRLLIHAQKGFHVGVSAVRQRRHEQVRRDDFARIRVHDPGRVARPVHLHEFARLVVQVHGCAGRAQVVVVVFAELRRLVRQFATRPARFTVLEPQQVQRHAALLHLPMHLSVIRHPVLWFF